MTYPCLEAEQVVECMKNVLLVMLTQGLFTGRTEGYNELWTLTWQRIGAFCPGMQA